MVELDAESVAKNALVVLLQLVLRRWQVRPTGL
jgi:hypothetical protein